MLASLRKRRASLLYLLCSSALLAFCFLTTASRNSLTSHTSMEIYPWQMVNYDEYKCGCPRSGPPIATSGQHSLCSDWSSSRGAGQKVVSYTIYGNMSHEGVYRQYYSAVEDRIKDVANYYKGWIMRLYHNMSRSDPKAMGFICHLYCLYPHFDPCQVDHLYPTAPSTTPKPTPVGTTPGFSMKKGVSTLQSHPGDGGEAAQGEVRDKGMDSEDVVEVGTEGSGRSKDGEKDRWSTSQHFKSLHQILSSRRRGEGSYERLLVGRMWRFVVMGDPLVSEFLVRDTDSVILAREVAAVDQWLHNSTALLHIMRDHPSHNGLILAGMWGGSRTRGGEKMTEMLQAMMRWPPRNIWDYDQVLLKRVVWPEMLDTVLAHDSYFCGNPHFQSRHRSQPFPTQRVGRYFVGWGPTRDHELPGITMCPSLCRPPQHQDWLYC